jgi:hypothetical protein
MIYTFLIQQFLFGILALFISYSIGKLITSFITLKGDFFFQIFINYIIGISAIVFIYAIIKSHGCTVMLLQIPIIVFLLYYYKSYFSYKIIIVKKLYIQEFFWSLAPFILIFLYQSWYYFDFINSKISVVWSDYYSYSSVSEILRNVGIEDPDYSIFSNTNVQTIALTPYHYPEHWLTAFFSTLFHISAIQSYYFILYPLLLSIFCLGLCSLFKNKITSKLLIIIISFLLLFIAGVHIPFIQNNYQSLNFSNSNIAGFLSFKMAWISIFLLLAFIVWKFNRTISYVLLTAIPIYSSTFVPSMWGGLLLLFMLLILKDFNNSIKTHLYCLIGILLILFSYFLFYHIFSKITLNSFITTIISKNPFLIVLHSGVTIQNIKITIGNLISLKAPYPLSNFLFILYLFPIIILLCFNIIKNNKYLWMICSLFFVGGYFTSTLFYGMLDSNQFSTNLIIIPIILLVIEIINVLDNFNLYRIQVYILIPLLLYALFVGKFTSKNNLQLQLYEDTDLLRKSSSVINKKIAPICVFYNKKTYKQMGNKFFWWQAYNNFKMLSQYNQNTLVFFLGNPELYEIDKSMSMNDSLYFNAYTPLIAWQKQSKSNNLQNFIKHFNVKYFCFDEDVSIPIFIDSLAVMRIESPQTHSIFIKIK